MAKSSPLSGRIGSRFGGRGARKRTRIIFASLLIIFAGSFATTLAANVTISGGNAIEFGQGQVPAIACDTTVTSALTEVWNNDTSNFHVQRITLSGLNLASPSESANASDSGCGTKTIRVSLLGSNGSPLNLGAGNPTEISFTVPTGAANPAASPSTANVAVTVPTTAASGQAVITLATSSPASSDARAIAANVARVVLETD
jgi:hypothetical protein